MLGIIHNFTLEHIGIIKMKAMKYGRSSTPTDTLYPSGRLIPASVMAMLLLGCILLT